MIRDILVEAVQRAESVGVPHANNRILTLVDQTNPRKRISWTLDEARKQIAMIDGYKTARLN